MHVIYASIHIFPCYSALIQTPLPCSLWLLVRIDLFSCSSKFSKDFTQTKQQSPESPKVTAVNIRYTLWWSLCTSGEVYVPLVELLEDVPLVEFMYRWWNLCTAGEVYVPLVEFIRGCNSGGVYVPLVEFIR